MGEFLSDRYMVNVSVLRLFSDAGVLHDGVDGLLPVGRGDGEVMPDEGSVKAAVEGPGSDGLEICRMD